MQLDFYSIMNQYRSHMNQQDKYVETRSVSTDFTETELEELAIDSNYKQVLRALSKKSRSYSHVCYSDCDNLYELELQGACDYCRAYTLVFDFSQTLDYLLSSISKCSIDDVRKIENYSYFSKAFLERTLKPSDGTLERLLGLSANLDQHLTQLYEMVESKFRQHPTQEEESIAMTRLFFKQLYQEIYRELADLRKACVVRLKVELSQFGFIYRSKSITGAICSCNRSFDDVLEVVRENGLKCTVPVTSYKRFEHALIHHPDRGGRSNEITRTCPGRC